MMITVNLTGGVMKDGKLTGANITGSVNGKSFGVVYTEGKYKEMKRLEAEANEAISMVGLTAIVEQFMILTEDAYKEQVETACPNLVVNEATGKFFLKTTDGTVISSHPVPQALVDRILISVEKGLDFTPIIKFWTRFLRNPNYSDMKGARLANYVNQTIVDHELKRELIEKKGVAAATAIERATVYQTPITMEGLLVTYKVSKELLQKFDKETGKQTDRYAAGYDEDTGNKLPAALPDAVEDRIFFPAVQGLTGGNPFYCYELNQKLAKGQAINKGALKHFIKVGRVIELEKWEQVNTDDHNSCVPGLHAGNLDYIKGYQGAGTVTHNVFIDPMDIGAITDDGSGALRVRRYYVHSSNAGINRSIYHSSKFASMTDADWAEFRLKAIEESEAKAAEALDRMKEKAAL